MAKTALLCVATLLFVVFNLAYSRPDYFKRRYPDWRMRLEDYHVRRVQRRNRISYMKRNFEACLDDEGIACAEFAAKGQCTDVEVSFACAKTCNHCCIDKKPFAYCHARKDECDNDEFFEVCAKSCGCE